MSSSQNETGIENPILKLMKNLENKTDQLFFNNQNFIMDPLMNKNLELKYLNQNLFKPESQYKGKEMNVYFFICGNRRRVNIQCFEDEKVSSVIDKFRNKLDDRNNNKLFIYNTKKLNTSLTCSEVGFYDNCDIIVIDLKY